MQLDDDTTSFRTYEPSDRPCVEVQLDDDTWVLGDLCSWSRSPAGWWGNVSWSAGIAQNYLDTFPANRIRPDVIDRTPASARDTPPGDL